VAIHGLDLYAISAALDEVEHFYRRHASTHGAFVSQLQDLFAPFRERPSVYADAVQATNRSLRPYAQAIVHDLDKRYWRSSPVIRESVFLALQNARAVAAGLGYLESLPGPPLLSANERSRHFGRTLNQLLVHSGQDARGIVWAHNTHVGDSHATDGRFVGELSLGRLARRSIGEKEVFIVGFGTGVGDVLAAKRWGGSCETLSTPVPRPDSLEGKMLAAGERDRIWLFSPEKPAPEVLTRWVPHRAIGATFDPTREAYENYVPTQLAERYDAFIFLPHTHRLQALDWPSGLARCSRGGVD
jgi:erythromycin esterase-like protein